jgi:hypothetical protein
MNAKRNILYFINFYRVASRLVLIPFNIGVRSPNGLQQQLEAEENYRSVFQTTPKAIARLININIPSLVKEKTGEIKVAMQTNFPTLLMISVVITTLYFLQCAKR